MEGVEIGHFNGALDAIFSAYRGLMSIKVGGALRSVSSTFGKGDTLVLDGTPEILLMNCLRRYDSQAILITEEMGIDELSNLQPDFEDPRRFRTVFLADPMDRSTVLRDFLNDFDQTKTISEVMRSKDTRRQWEAKCGASASISGASSAITCVRRGLPIFSIIVNYVTQQLFVSCGAGNFVLPIPADTQRIDLEYIREHGTKISFRRIDTDHHEKSMRRFVTFTGKSGYRENLEASNLMETGELESNLYYSLPGGPSRILYLSEFQPASAPLGFILANGEKIGEWIHWLPFVRFAKSGDDQSESAFLLYEIFPDSIRSKDGVLMATPPAYSIFQPSVLAGGKNIIDVRRVSTFTNPSRIRSTLMVVPSGNSLMTLLTRQNGHREIRFATDW